MEDFRADFDAFISNSGLSLRALEKTSGWSKSAIWKARRSSQIPNADLVEAVINACGASSEVASQWRARVVSLARMFAATPTKKRYRLIPGRARKASLIGFVSLSVLLASVLGGMAVIRYWHTRPPANMLGGIDVALACQDEYPTFANVWAYPRDSNNPYTWTCTSNGLDIPGSHGVDMNRACRRQFGGSAYAMLVWPEKSISWRCVR